MQFLIIRVLNLRPEMIFYSNIYPTRCNVTQFILSGNCSTLSGGTTTHHWERKNCIYSIWYFSHRYCYLPLIAAARLLKSWVRIPPGAWIFVCCECRVLSGRGLCDELITRPEESYRLWCVVLCDPETSWMRRPWPTGGCRARNKQTNYKFNVHGSVHRINILAYNILAYNPN